MKGLILFVNLNANNVDLPIFPVIKVDSSPSVSNHPVICYNLSPDKPLSYCGSTIKGQEVVESTYGLNALNLFVLKNLLLAI